MIYVQVRVGDVCVGVVWPICVWLWGKMRVEWCCEDVGSFEVQLSCEVWCTTSSQPDKNLYCVYTCVYRWERVHSWDWFTVCERCVCQHSRQLPLWVYSCWRDTRLHWNHLPRYVSLSLWLTVCLSVCLSVVLLVAVSRDQWPRAANLLCCALSAALKFL